MNKQRLSKIINLSKETSNVKDPFIIFEGSLTQKPQNYRLKEAWEQYGKPKSYKEAIDIGLIKEINGIPKFASIGYNEDTDEYEYLNTGRDNDVVNRDLRVWDNDVIPFVKELKQGGYIKIYDNEKDCWKYSKQVQNEQREVIEQFQKGGKSSKKEKNDQTYAEFIATLPPNLQEGNDGEDGYRMRYAFDNSPDVWTFDDAKGTFIDWSEKDQSWHGVSVFGPTGEFLKPLNHPTLWMEEAAYMSSKPKLINGKEDNGNPENYVVVPMTGKEKEDMDNFRNRFDLVKTDENGNLLKYWKYVPKQSTQAFKQGGQMNVIPEGALHARKNNMEGAGKDFTAKGIPVVTTDGKEQTAEIEKDEIIFTLEVTKKIESWYKKYNDSDSNKEKDEIAIECGKYLTEQILRNTEDRTGLITKIQTS